MDLGSPENGFEELNDLLKDDDSNLVEELGLSFTVNKEDNALNYGFENLTSSNEFYVDVNEQSQQAPHPSLPSDFPYYDFPLYPPEKFQSPRETGFDAVALCETKDQELLQSPSKDLYHQEGIEQICCSYLSEFPSQDESAPLQHEIEAEVLVHLVESPLRQEASQEIEMEDRPASPLHEAMVQETFFDMSAYESVISDIANNQVEDEVLEHPTEILQASPRLFVDKSETDNDHIHQSRISPIENKKPVIPPSPRRSPQVSTSPERDRQMSITFNVSPGQKQRSSPKIFDMVKRVNYSIPSERKDSTSPLRSRQSKQPTDSSSSKRSSVISEFASQEVETENRPASPPHEAMVQETFLDMPTYESVISEFAKKQVEDDVLEYPTEILHASPRLFLDKSETDNDHIHRSRISSVENKKPEMPFSPRRSPQVSPSPERDRQMSITDNVSPGSSNAASHKSLGSHGQEQDFSLKNSDMVKRVDYSLPSGRKDSASPLRYRQSKRPTDSSSSKRLSISPRNHHLHQNLRRRDRSRSKSPIRQKESDSRQKTKHHDRSRSRSPYKRDYHRRSPRRRHSPRRKSPPSDYHHSRRRSSRRRPWSPPHNRSTGLGKPGRILFVAGFSFLTTERDLDRKFSRYGRVRDVHIIRDKRSGDSRGFGFITLERDEEADAAIRALDKTEWNGRIVLVEKSKSH